MSTLFVDESKSKGYTMVAAVVVAGDVEALRREIRTLVLPGQRRIHFTKESDSRRRQVLSQLVSLGVRVHIFHCADRSDAVGRKACLVGLVEHAAQHAHTNIVLERDESVEEADRRTLFHEVKKHGLTGNLSYGHETAHQEPLLWIADAIAWSYTKGGDWKRRIQPLIATATSLSA